MPAAGQRDVTGVVLWIGFAAGCLMCASAYGDIGHLRSVMDAGVITACGAAVALLSRWVSRGQVPGAPVPITDAPSALVLAELNAEEIRLLKLRVGGMLLLMKHRPDGSTLPGAAAQARQAQRGAEVLQFPLERAGKSGDSQAGLCPALGPPPLTGR